MACRCALLRAVSKTVLVHSPITRRATLGTICLAPPARRDATRCCSALPNRRPLKTPATCSDNERSAASARLHFLENVFADSSRRAFGYTLG